MTNIVVIYRDESDRRAIAAAFDCIPHFETRIGYKAFVDAIRDPDPEDIYLAVDCDITGDQPTATLRIHLADMREEPDDWHMTLTTLGINPTPCQFRASFAALNHQPENRED